MKLFTVGPVACYPEVLEEMKRQMFSHRSSEYKKLHSETVTMLQNFIETTNQIFLFSSTGTGFMEASVRNCVDEKMLCCVSGSFGQRFVDVAVANGKTVEILEPPLGEPVTPDLLDDKLQRCHDVEAVALTHNETSVGLINPLDKLAEIVKQHGKLCFVDAVSSMGGVEINVGQSELDVCFASSQKCFGVPPGLGIGSVSQEALRKSETAKNKGWYFDFKVWERYQQAGGTPVTSVIPQIFALNKVLKLIDHWGGKAEYFKLYAERNRRIVKGIENLGLTLFPKKEYASPTVNCINAPPSTTGIKIYQRMREKGFELAKGYGSIKNATFRIGNMGYIELQDIDAMLQALEEVVGSTSIP